MKPKALYPGSFDPFTRGHEDIVLQGIDRYDMSVAIGENPEKKGLFAPQERVRIAQNILREHMDPLKVVRLRGSTARYAERNMISRIIRGKRNMLDEIVENQYAELSRLENPDLVFEVFDADPTLQYASSSAAKELVKIGHDPSSLVRLSVQEAVSSRILSQYPVYVTGGMGAGKSTVSRGLEEVARDSGLAVKRIELDTVAHDIYTTLTDPYYVHVRETLVRSFGGDIADDRGWIIRSRLAEKLYISGTREFDADKLDILNTIMNPAIRFRYQDMVEGFQGIIIVDGVIRPGGDDIVKRYAQNHSLFVDADMSSRIERVGNRYREKGNPKDDSYIRSMMEFQGTSGTMRQTLDTSIAKEKHGDRIDIDNSGIGPDMRKTFFSLLNQIDTYGELRAEWILRKLGIEGDVKAIIRNLQSEYNHPNRYYHTWEHIVESLTTLLDMAIAVNLSDEDIAIIGGALLGHDLIYTVSPENYAQNESNSAREWVRILESKGVKRSLLECIEDLIKETRHGRIKISDTLRSHIMHDVDMSILGASEERYRQYASDLRPEFRPMASGTEFERLRRDKFLIPVSELGPSIYKTEYARDTFGTRVTQNLRAEIEGILRI